jgi:hypothetical protein
MVGGAAGGVHRAGRGRPRYAQVARKGTAESRAVDPGRPVGFQLGLFAIVLRLICPLFFRALWCTARGAAGAFSPTNTAIWPSASAARRLIAPVFALYFH